MSNWFIDLSYEGQLATWLTASFLLYVLASQLVWQFQWHLPAAFSLAEPWTGQPQAEQHTGQDDRLVETISRLWEHPLFPWAVEFVRLVYYLGIPFLAAVNGLLGADLLGISGTDWAQSDSVQGFLWEDWVRGLGLATLATLAVLVVWSAGRLAARKAGLEPVARGVPGPLWVRCLDALYDQIHWAFYRSGPILWLGDPYWGTLAGLAWVVLELALNPATWWKLKSPDTATPVLIRLGMASISALLFLATQNLWLIVGTHLVVASVLGARDAPSYAPVDESIA